MIFLALIASMLISSIPFGIVFALYLSNKDPRYSGSLNIGMTNAWRVCGWQVGLLTLAGDLGKSAFLLSLFNTYLTAHELSLLAFSTVFFHCYSVYLKLKGGKGLASASGVLLIIDPFWFSMLFLAGCSLESQPAHPALLHLALFPSCSSSVLPQYLSTKWGSLPFRLLSHGDIEKMPFG